MFRRFGDIMTPLSRNKNANSKGGRATHDARCRTHHPLFSVFTYVTKEKLKWKPFNTESLESGK